MEVGRFGSDGAMAGRVAAGLGMRRLRSPLPFSPSFMAVMLGDTVFQTDGVHGRVEAAEEDGTLVRVFDVPGKVWALQAAFQSLKAALDSSSALRLDRLEGTNGLDTIPTVSDMLKGEEDRLWFKTYSPDTDSQWVSRRRTGGEWIVVTTSGTPVARVAAPRNVRLMDIRGNHVAGVATDDLGVERVQVFTLHRG
jgi:antitoxin (DNA-binding transcriptional repressor) of toxin-antitoxin stability system